MGTNCQEFERFQKFIHYKFDTTLKINVKILLVMNYLFKQNALTFQYGYGIHI